MVLSVHPATTVPVLRDEKDKAGERRRKGMGGWYRHENVSSPHPLSCWPCNVLCDLAAAAMPLCARAQPGCSADGASSALLSYGTGTQIIVLFHLMSCPLTYWCEAVLEATSGCCLTPSISSTVSTDLPASALLAQHWGFGSSDCTVFLFLFTRSFSTCISSEGEEIPIALGGCFLLKFNTISPSRESLCLDKVSEGTVRWPPWVSVVSGIWTTAFVYEAGEPIWCVWLELSGKLESLSTCGYKCWSVMSDHRLQMKAPLRSQTTGRGILNIMASSEGMYIILMNATHRGVLENRNL